jgi:hypothetical protein
VELARAASECSQAKFLLRQLLRESALADAAGADLNFIRRAGRNSGSAQG